MAVKKKQQQKKRWLVPNKRARSYASELKAGKHEKGKKLGNDLTDFEAGLRSGYLQCQTDSAELYKFKKRKKAEKK